MKSVLLVIFAILLLQPSKAFACSCGDYGVVKTSELIEGFDYVFVGTVEEQTYFGNDEETKSARILVSKQFVGSLPERTNLEFAGGLGNCSGNYFNINHSKVFFLKEADKGKVNAASWCSLPSQYLYSVDHLENYFERGQDEDLISWSCVNRLEIFKKFGFGRTKTINDSVLKKADNCFDFLDDFQAGKFYTKSRF